MTFILRFQRLGAIFLPIAIFASGAMKYSLFYRRRSASIRVNPRASLGDLCPASFFSVSQSSRFILFSIRVDSRDSRMRFSLWSYPRRAGRREIVARSLRQAPSRRLTGILFI
jgi:hypothetical protein